MSFMSRRKNDSVQAVMRKHGVTGLYQKGRQTLCQLLAVGGLALCLPNLAGAADSPVWTAHSPGAVVDAMSWQYFIQAVTPMPNGHLTFESWATDDDTYPAVGQKPVWPSADSEAASNGKHHKRQRFEITGFRALIMNFSEQDRAVFAASHDGANGLLTVGCELTGGNNKFPVVGSPPETAPGKAYCLAEEVRRNRPEFDYIVDNNLYSKAGLAAAFKDEHKKIEFPADSIEVKVDWVPMDGIKKWLSNTKKFTDEQIKSELESYYPIEEGGVQYGMVAMHVTSKILPNWLWATWEHRNNPGRCDSMGCYDEFGSVNKAVEPNKQWNTVYNGDGQDCKKTEALQQLFKAAHIDKRFDNYCLKASQIDFVSQKQESFGKPLLDGNTVTEGIAVATPVAISSCISCHAAAGFNAAGEPNVAQLSEAPIGNLTIDKDYKPYDFVWSLLQAK